MFPLFYFLKECVIATIFFCKYLLEFASEAIWDPNFLCWKIQIMNFICLMDIVLVRCSIPSVGFVSGSFVAAFLNSDFRYI